MSGHVFRSRMMWWLYFVWLGGVVCNYYITWGWLLDPDWIAWVDRRGLAAPTIIDHSAPFRGRGSAKYARCSGAQPA